MRPQTLAFLSAFALGLAACASGPPPVKPTAGDLERLQAATQEALETAQTGQSVNWRNPTTGHRGSVTVLATDTGGARPCREVQRVFTAGDTTRTGRAVACRTDEGDWTLERAQDLLTADQRARVQTRARHMRYGYWPYHGPRYGPYRSGSGLSFGLGIGTYY